METNASPSAHTRAGTLGGTLLTILLQLSGQEVLKTAVMAATGAAVSFLLSTALQGLVKRRKKDNHC